MAKNRISFEMSAPYEKDEHLLKRLYEYLPRCPICKSEADYEFLGWVKSRIKCRKCRATWLVEESGMELVERPQRNFPTDELMGKKQPWSFWQELNLKEESTLSSGLESTTKNIGYYSGLVFGLGYIITMLSALAFLIEILSKIPSAAWSNVPAWLGATLFFVFLAIVCGIYLGWSIIKNSKSIRDFGLRIDHVSSTVSAFSFMILFLGIASIITAASYQETYPYTGFSFSLFSPICTVAGAILLLIGFHVYRDKPMESKLIGGILMLVSVILIYFVAYTFLREFYGFYESALGVSISLPPFPGPLLAEANIEAAVLLIATVCAILFAVPAFGEGRGRSIVGMILSAGGILFSCGVLYFNFSALSILSKFLSIPKQPLVSPWIMFFGFLVLGISGIIILIGACLPIAISVKQLFEVGAPRVVAPELAANVKYCPKCGAGMPLEATYCPKCGKKQAKS